MKKIFFPAITCTFLSVNVLSQIDSVNLADTVSLDEVVVTGSPVKVNKNNVPMAVSVINREQIAESSESDILPVLNGRVPGLFVTERGVTGFGVATGAAGQITMRGIGGSPTTGILMLIDGHPQFMGIFGHPLADSYVSSDVERVEVIRGPASILYGSNAMGGVINIITRKQTEEGLHGNGNIMYGSYNTQKYMASGGFKKNKLLIFASVNHDRTDGHRPRSDFNITNGYVKLGYTLNNNIRANTDISLAKFKATDPGPDTLNAVPGSSLDIKRGYWAFTLDNDYPLSSGTVKLFYNFGEHFISDGFHSNDANYGLNVFESLKLFKGSSMTLGVDYVRYGGIAENEKAMNGDGMIFKDTTLYETAIYGFVQQSIYERLILNAGLRAHYHEVYGLKWIPAAGFAFKVTTQTTWKCSVAKGFRSPTIQELYIWNHNPSLDPETVLNYETGIIQSLYKQKLKFEFTGFVVRGDNLIINVPQEGMLNAGEVSNKGMEFAADVNLIHNFTLNATYSYIDMKNPVYATPRHHAFLSGRYSLNNFSVMANIQYINHLDTDPSASVHFQDYTLLNAKISYNIWKYAEVFISGENLLDQGYETNRYYPMPGITAFGGLNLKF
jgi:outer membrane cobalamin receptor